MSGTESAARGLALLTDRVARANAFVDRVPRILDPLLESPRHLPRMLVTTGIGTSEGHARHLAEAAVRWGRQPARFATTGSLSRGAPHGAVEDWLVVFSQGLSANARFALRDLDDWGGVVLVTGLPAPGDAEFDTLDPQKRHWLLDLRDRGVVQIEMGCGAEYGTLLRVIGARVGYALGWSLLRTLASRRFESVPELVGDGLEAHGSRDEARREMERVFPIGTPLAPFFDGSRTLLLVAEGGALELAYQLALKVSEGMLRPQPGCVDVLHFAHGPLQSLAERPTSILYLAGAREDEAEQCWLERFERTLDSRLHDLRVLRAKRRLPFSVLEYEAIFDELILRYLTETGLDLVDWPGADREKPLYAEGPARLEDDSIATSSQRAPRKVCLEETVWPEVEGAVAAGGQTAVIALGSIEQHGPHLPLGTDRWIAEALARGLAQRHPEAVALPAIAFGCASEHMAFPGTLHLEPATLESVLGDLLVSLAAHGFGRAFVFSAHGGNVAALDAMRGLLENVAAPLEVLIESDLEAVATMQAAAVEAEGIDALAAGLHAGEYETSLVAALRPDSIRRRALAPGECIENVDAQSLFYPSLRDHVQSGVLGDPSSPSAERGRRYLAAWLGLLDRAYRVGFAGRAE
jgi:creatinine amidohydrolase